MNRSPFSIARARHHFSLVELMMAVAILMTLTALALPMLYTAQLKSRKSELATNVDGLMMAEQAYFAASDVWFTTTSYAPTSSPGKSTHAWAGYPTIGFVPSGDVRGAYRLAANGTAYCQASTFVSVSCTLGTICVSGMADLDANGIRTCAYMTPESSTTAWYNKTEF